MRVLGSLLILSILALPVASDSSATINRNNALLFGKDESFDHQIRKLREQNMQDLLRMDVRKTSFKKASVQKSSLKYLSQFIAGKLKENLPKNWKPQSQEIARVILEQSRRYKLDPIFVLSVIHQESGFRPSVRGGHGEIGLMQLRPETAEWIANRNDIAWLGKNSLENPYYNIKIGTAYLAYLRSTLPSGKLFISAYNMGVGNVLKNVRNKRIPNEYSSKILTHYKKYNQTIFE